MGYILGPNSTSHPHIVSIPTAIYVVKQREITQFLIERYRWWDEWYIEKHSDPNITFVHFKNLDAAIEFKFNL